MLPVIELPRRIQSALSSAVLPHASEGARFDFTSPPGEEALAAPDSVSWRIFKNPIALSVGGMAAVILELAEPRVRTGVWHHSTFRDDTVGRLRRTGAAAMVTVYGARSVSEPLIKSVVRMHTRIRGTTASGEHFCANDPELLRWVQTTATFGFGAAYSRYVAALSPADLDRLYREAVPAARLYGACDIPDSARAMQAAFEAQRERLEESPVVLDFLRIMGNVPMLPLPLRWVQPMLVRAAVDLVPEWIRARLRLGASCGLRPVEKALICLVGALSDRVVLPLSPPALSCERLGLPKTYLFERQLRGQGHPAV